MGAGLEKRIAMQLMLLHYSAHRRCLSSAEATGSQDWSPSPQSRGRRPVNNSARLLAHFTPPTCWSVSTCEFLHVRLSVRSGCLQHTKAAPASTGLSRVGDLAAG